MFSLFFSKLLITVLDIALLKTAFMNMDICLGFMYLFRVGFMQNIFLLNLIIHKCVHVHQNALVWFKIRICNIESMNGSESNLF